MQRIPPTRNTSLTITFQGDFNDKPNFKALSPSPVVRVKKNVVNSIKDTEHLDELDLILCHEEFEALVALSKKVKNLHQILRRGAPEALIYYEQNMPATPKSALTSKEVMAFVQRLRQDLSNPSIVIRRGMFPVTDASLDDNFAILQRELEYCESCIRKAATLVTAPADLMSSPSCSSKYAKWQSDILFHWLVDNHKAPKLRREVCVDLASRTGLTPHQVSTWLQNMRRRRQTNTVKGTKKAAHFLDYLFLAHERDQTNADAQEVASTSPHKRARWYDDTTFEMTGSPSLMSEAPYGHASLDSLVPPPHAMAESLEDSNAMEIEPVDLLEFEFNLSKHDEKELLQVFAQAWHHEAQVVAAAFPPPPPESRDDEEYDDFAMDLMGDDISPFDSGIFRKRTLGGEGIMDESEVAVTAL
jgi:hypothetical protein